MLLLQHQAGVSQCTTIGMNQAMTFSISSWLGNHESLTPDLHWHGIGPTLDRCWQASAITSSASSQSYITRDHLVLLS